MAGHHAGAGALIMDIARFGSFVRVIDAGSFSRAAEQLGLTQSALSQQIAALEADFGSRLVLRGRQGVTATVAGQALYPHARLIVRQLEDAESAIRAPSATMVGSVSLGLERSISALITIPLLLAIRERYPDIAVCIVEGSTEQLLDRLVSGKLDIAVLMETDRDQGLVRRLLVSEALFLFGSAVREPALGPTIMMSQASKREFILPSRDHPLRKFIDDRFGASEIALRVAVECDSLTETLSAVSDGQLATILPWGCSLRCEATLNVAKIVKTGLDLTSGLYVTESLPLSPAAVAVNLLIPQVTMAVIATGKWEGARSLMQG